MIKNVEALGAELQFGSFANLKILGDQEIQLRDSRSDQRVPPQVAEGAQRLRYEGARIEVQRGRPHRRAWRDSGAPAGNTTGWITAGARRQIRTIGEASSRQLVLGTIRGVFNREGNTARKG